MSELITTLSLASLREALQQVGFRVEQSTDPIARVEFLRSATSGVGFDVRPGSPGVDGGFVDVAFIAVLQVQGELPLGLVNNWNGTRRFARLQLGPQLLALSLDVSVAGGVSPQHLRSQIEIWDHLLQDLIGYLREELRRLPAPNGQPSQAGAPAAETSVPAPVN